MALNLKHDDAIISFNYTNTYNRVYINNIVRQENIHFIHGEARLDNKGKNNMIIGIDETLDESINERLDYVRFKKYFQRIIKGSDTSYKKIFKNKTNSDEPIEVFVFGHSLDVTDRDIIRDIFTDEKTTVTVFSYDEESQIQHVANLIKIIDKEEVIKSTYDDEPKVKFKLQTV